MILQKMLSFMEKYHMLDGCKTLVIGVSGGADSVCLLLLLEKVCKERGILPVVVHIEHGIRGKESLSDAAFVENLCKQKDILFHRFSYAVEKIAKESGESTEEAGRRLRYDTFFQVAEQYEQAKIAVAHNENDQAETVLFHLARGSGIKGMGGIPPVRGNIIRPLLGVSRAEIEQYLKEAGQPYCTDSTNALDIYARNRIRHEALPSLNGVNAQAVSHIGAGQGSGSALCERRKAGRTDRTGSVLCLPGDPAKADRIRSARKACGSQERYHQRTCCPGACADGKTGGQKNLTPVWTCRGKNL